MHTIRIRRIFSSGWLLASVVLNLVLAALLLMAPRFRSFRCWDTRELPEQDSLSIIRNASEGTEMARRSFPETDLLATMDLCTRGA